MMYTVKEIADLAGVTPRTLRYYDEIGLLDPCEVGNNGYRYYDRDSLIRLQQILFFRELGFPLQDIGRILHSPEFNPLAALENHHQALKNKVRRLERLVNTIELTIANLKGNEMMTEKDLFDGFDETQYEAEVQQRWGSRPQYRESRKNWSSYTEDQRNEIKKLGGRIIKRMVTDNPQASAEDFAVQEAVKDYFDYLNRYFYTCDLEMFRELAKMWVEDSRFALNFENIREGGAEFARRAVDYFCDQRLENESG